MTLFESDPITSGPAESAPTIPTTVRLTDPESILAAIPFLVGFHPEESMVLLVLRRGRVKVTARIDVEAPPDALAAKFEEIRANHNGDAMVLVVYTADALVGLTAGAGVVEHLTDETFEAVIVADGEFWWSLLDDHGDEDSFLVGTPYDLGCHVVSAHGVLAGAAVLPDRNALAATVAGPNGRDREIAERAFEEALFEVAEMAEDDRADLMAMLVENFCVHEPTLTPRQCAELAVLAYDIRVRDVAAQRIRLEDAALHVELWRQVVQHTIEPFECAPLCLLGLAGWVSGSGALQVVCMERVERINPDYSLLHVLEEINTRCLAPSVWQEVRGS